MLEFDESDFEEAPISQPLTISTDGIVFDKMIEGLPNETYHSYEGVSSTQFQMMRLSNTVFDNRKLFSVQKPAYDIGNLIHDAILLPHLVDFSYLECVTIGLDTKVADKQRKDNSDKIIVGKGDIEKAKEIAKKVRLIYGCILIPEGTKKEVSFFHLNKEYNMVFRIRPDIYNQLIGLLMDIKSSKANNHKEFEKIIEEYDYDLSIAFYFDVLQMCGYPVFRKRTGWIVVPKTAPHAPFSFIVSEELLEKGRSKYQTLLVQYMEYKKRQAESGEGDIGYLFDDLFSKQAHSWAYKRENY